MSQRLYDFCYSHIYELASAFNKVLLSGKLHGLAFDEVMDILKVPENERKNILSQASCSSIRSVGKPYQSISPLNQFIVTIPGYVSYCLRNKLPDEEKLRQECEKLLILEGLPRYLQEQIGVKISREIKGTLWRPVPVWVVGMAVKILIVFFTIFISTLLFFLRESLVLIVSSYIAGALILLFWIYNLLLGKAYTYIVGSIHHFTVWKFTILPLLTSICLFLSGNIMFIPLGILFLFVPFWLERLFMFDLAYFMPFILSIVYGWNIGVRIGELLVVPFPYWKIVFGITGIIVIQIVCSLVVCFITGRKW